ncbi:MAG TPA: MmgE/PrpD family protein [Rhizobiaceae bacterium]|nr:MmgE/PrpD family protein [Rhizobiaceae bacterium]
MIEDIATRVADLSFDALSEAGRERLTLCLLANLSVGVAGVPYCVVPEPVAEGGRFALLSGSRAGDARAAAFWNAAVMHARTQDDFDPVGNLHVGTVVLPALMAVSNEVPLTGKAFLDALAAGYMVAVGISRGLSPKTTPRGVRSTGYYSPFGAVAAVAKAKGLDAAAIGSALALTTVFAGGTTQAWIDGSDEWQLHPAHAAETGLRAVELALSGVRGGSHALDGTSGFYNALLGKTVPFDEVVNDFDPSIAAEESVIKRFPVSGICQSVVLSAERLARQIADPGQIRRVKVEMNAFEMRYPGTLNRGPVFRSFGDRLMSATFCTASVLAHRGLNFADFHTAQNAARDRLVGLVEVIEGADIPILSARMTVETGDGRTFVEQVRNSRSEVAIDWFSVDAWGSALWQEAGRSSEAFKSCRDEIQTLSRADRVDFGRWL